MRFGLFALLAVVSLLAMCLAMIVPHGFFGVILLLPHLLAVSCVALLIRRARRRMALLISGAYVACWAVTVFSGGPNVCEHLRSQAAALRYAHLHDHGELRRVDYDPVLDDSRPHVEIPWYFVGNESSPCPFVVTVDYAVTWAPLSGGGGRLYVVWCFGFKWTIAERLNWSS